MALIGELLQWPLLQLVPVVEILNGQVLEMANGLSKVRKDWVYNRRRRAPETTNVDILRRICLPSHPTIDSACGVLCEALVHLFLVQHDLAALDVLGALRDDFSLVGQEIERSVVDTDSKFIRRDDVED